MRARATTGQQEWNRILSATIGASVAEDRLQRPSPESWWLGVPREQWAAAVSAQTPRMATSKMARTITSQILAWKG